MRQLIAASVIWGLFVIITAPLVLAQEQKAKGPDKKAKPKFTIAQDTTYLTEPLDNDGYPDYIKALNDRLSKGVTPDNNANVLLWQAFGPQPDGAKLTAEYFKLLRIAPPTAKGNYFVDLFTYHKTTLKIDTTPLEAWKEIEDQQEQTSARPWTTKQFPNIASWLKANDNPLALALKAAKCPRYYSPLVPSPKGKERPTLNAATNPGAQPHRRLAAALVTRAMLHLGEGRLDEAWQDLHACQTLGRFIAREQSLQGFLVGCFISAIAHEGNLAFIDQAKFTPMQMAKFTKNLHQLPAMPTIADCLDGQERLALLEQVLLLDRDPETLQKGVDLQWRFMTAFKGLGNGGHVQLVLDLKLLMDEVKDMLDGTAVRDNGTPTLDLKAANWDLALRNINQHHDRLTAALRIKDRAERHIQLNQIAKVFKKIEARLLAEDWTKILVSPAILGEFLTVPLLPAFQSILGAEERAEQNQRNLQIAFALAAYRSDNGKYPSKLDDLAPKYLPIIPDDLFTGKPLIYRPAADGYLLYSFGANGQDDQGRNWENDPIGDDLRIRMPLPPIKKQ